MHSGKRGKRRSRARGRGGRGAERRGSIADQLSEAFPKHVGVQKAKRQAEPDIGQMIEETLAKTDGPKANAEEPEIETSDEGRDDESTVVYPLVADNAAAQEVDRLQHLLEQRWFQLKVCLIIVISMLVGGIILSAYAVRWDRMVATLTAKNSALREQSTQDRHTLAVVIDKTSALRKENAGLKSSIGDLQEANTSCNAASDQCYKEKGDLQARVDDLQRTNGRLVQQKEKLQNEKAAEHRHRLLLAGRFCKDMLDDQEEDTGIVLSDAMLTQLMNQCIQEKMTR